MGSVECLCINTNDVKHGNIDRGKGIEKMKKCQTKPGDLLKEYFVDLGIHKMSVSINVFLDNVILKLNYRVPEKYKKAVLFLLEREMIEHHIEERYGREEYDAFKESLSR